MKRLLLFVILLASAGFIITSNFTSNRVFKKLPLDKLRSEKVQYEKDLADYQKKLKEDSEPKDEITKRMLDLSSSLNEIDIEITLKKYYVDAIALLALILTALWLLFTRYRGKLSVEDRTVDSIIKELDIGEDPPKEIYVDDWEYQKKIEGGFKTKKEAVEWIKSDPSLQCDYCGSRLRSTMTGKKEAVQLVTFYKKVPDGAKDLRVVKGSFWFSKAATELRCPSCDRVIKR